jgi:hypothetical protein
MDLPILSSFLSGQVLHAKLESVEFVSEFPLSIELGSFWTPKIGTFLTWPISDQDPSFGLPMLPLASPKVVPFDSTPHPGQFEHVEPESVVGFSEFSLGEAGGSKWTPKKVTKLT